MTQLPMIKIDVESHSTKECKGLNVILISSRILLRFFHIILHHFELSETSKDISADFCWLWIISARNFSIFSGLKATVVNVNGLTHRQNVKSTRNNRRSVYRLLHVTRTKSFNVLWSQLEKNVGEKRWMVKRGTAFSTGNGVCVLRWCTISLIKAYILFRVNQIIIIQEQWLKNNYSS